MIAAAASIKDEEKKTLKVEVKSEQNIDGGAHDNPAFENDESDN